MRALAVSVLSTMAVFVILMAPGKAQGLSQTDRQAIASVIESQLDAFRRDDGVAAFAHASPTIRDMFGTPDIFMDMVRQGYAPVYRPQHYEFRSLDDSTAVPTQDVYLIGPDGGPVIARYTMQRQPDGSWRIAGCQLLDAGLSV